MRHLVSDPSELRIPLVHSRLSEACRLDDDEGFTGILTAQIHYNHGKGTDLDQSPHIGKVLRFNF
jgi:hypothetical protein